MKEVTNEEFLAAKENPEYIGMMVYTVEPFRKYIKKDDVNYLCDMALYLALARYREECGMKFISYLFLNVRWQLLGFMRQRRKFQQLQCDVSYEPPISSIYEITEILTDDERDILLKRHLHNMTLLEISKEYGVCLESIRRRLKKIKKKIQEKD